MFRILKTKNYKIFAVIALLSSFYTISSEANPIRTFCRKNIFVLHDPVCLRLKNLENLIRQDEDLLKHIHGKFTVNKEHEHRIAAGLHTVTGLIRFQQIRQDIPFTTETLDNGVIKVTFPTEAFHAKAWKKMQDTQNVFPGYLAGTKTLFPKTWSDEDILESIVDILILENHIPATGSHNIIKKDRGINISVQMWHGRVISAFPWFDQAV